MKGNCIFAQSGGPTAVINASIGGAILEARSHDAIERSFGAVNGILGVLNEEFLDLDAQSEETVRRVMRTPSSALGSCRYKVSQYDREKILEILQRRNIRYFFINGGNDSMDTGHKLERMAKEAGYELRVMGIPKTIDNDLSCTDHCPGYGSAARWVAMSVRDAGRDTDAIYTSDTVKVIETMGRNAGWLTAAAAFAREAENDAPHLIYLPERPVERGRFIKDVKAVYGRIGRAVIVVCEGLKDEAGEFVSASGSKLETDGFGHKQMGGASAVLCDWVMQDLGIKARYDKPGTIQRVSMACASETDLQEAEACGREAVRLAAAGESGKMTIIKRVSSDPYKSKIGTASLEDAANAEKRMPDDFIASGGNDVTEAFLEYARPLLGGPLPAYGRFERVLA